MTTKTLNVAGKALRWASDDAFSIDWYSTLGLAQGGGASPTYDSAACTVSARRNDGLGGYQWNVGYLRWDVSTVGGVVSAASIGFDNTASFTDVGTALDVTMYINAISWPSGASTPVWAIQADTNYGFVTFTGPSQHVDVQLNAAGVAALNAAILAGTDFAVSLVNNHTSLPDLSWESIGIYTTAGYTQLTVTRDDTAITLGANF